MKVSDFDYELPEELIAQHPLQKRDMSRLLVYDRKSQEIHHRIFKDIGEYLRAGDCLVINDTKVIPARLYGVRKDSGGAIEFLLLERLENNKWEVLVKPGRRAKIGTRFIFGDGLLIAEVLDIGKEGERVVQFEYEGIFEEILDQIGNMPLPPYIHEKLEDDNRYQTVYAQHPGSAAAPTAGLHFTEELLDELKSKGINIAKVTLHVGLGTFRPVKTEIVEEHSMHAESYLVSKETADIINRCRQNGGRIVAVGTTSVRTLESVTDDKGIIHPGQGKTDIFIYPGYRFKAVDMLVTNFHLPRSTLLMLVSAFMGREEALRVYNIAVKERYRFFSFGDAMLII